MTVQFDRYAAAEARERRDIVQRVYEHAYTDAIAGGDPFDQVSAFMGRFDAYTDPARSAGFDLVTATDDGEPVGQTWGWPLRPGAAGWEGLVLDEGDVDEFTEEDGRRTFALSEIMVVKSHVGQGIARALHDQLLAARPEQRASLLVIPDNRRAYDRYRRWGWRRVGTLRPSWPDAPTFDVLDLPLPLG
ncbi:GNAT family N-acetyltransferase [Nocardia jiangsuensis]|uniref:GNAT family N-acetyltransferase n=1 Tax=Nocardia jiangsuensis TaxID=1691563 RepID=A0ABV8DTY1_9NOCA